MRRQLRTAAVMAVTLIALCGVVYPILVFGIGQVAFRHQADGSLVKNNAGQVVGSALVGQAFTDATGNPDLRYFQPRPSAAGDGYDAMASGASNLGPSSPELHTAEIERAAAYRARFQLAPNLPVPIDAITASGSGLDPHISVPNAKIQASQIAKVRRMDLTDVLAAVDRHTDGRQWGVLGEATVNVLQLNVDLDSRG